MPSTEATSTYQAAAAELAGLRNLRDAVEAATVSDHGCTGTLTLTAEQVDLIYGSACLDIVILQKSEASSELYRAYMAEAHPNHRWKVGSLDFFEENWECDLHSCCARGEPRG